MCFLARDAGVINVEMKWLILFLVHLHIGVAPGAAIYGYIPENFVLKVAEPY